MLKEYDIFYSFDEKENEQFLKKFKYYSVFYPVESSDSQKFSHVIYVRNTTELLQLLNYWNSKDSRWKCFCDLDEIPY